MIVYKIKKNTGSEDGVGYELTKIIANKVSNLSIITRSNNITHLSNDPFFKDVELIAVDVPKFLSFYKNKGRGVILYYYFWQICVGIKLYTLQNRKLFDVIHHLNFHALWSSHFVFSKKSKIIWGPLTRHPSIPFDFWHENIFKFLFEISKQIIKKVFIYCDPFLIWAIKRSDHIFLGHKDCPGPYKLAFEKNSLLPQAGNHLPVSTYKKIDKKFNILFVGRFVSLKGCIIAMKAVQKFISDINIDQNLVKITFIGEGPLKKELQKLSSNNPQISIIDWLPQDQLEKYYKQASLFLFPSLEGQGLVVAEALSYGLPVLCIENMGPHTVADYACITIEKMSADKVIAALTDKLHFLSSEYWNFPNLYQKRIELAFARAKELSWDNKANIIMDYYHG